MSILGFPRLPLEVLFIFGADDDLLLVLVDRYFEVVRCIWQIPHAKLELLDRILSRKYRLVDRGLR